MLYLTPTPCTHMPLFSQLEVLRGPVNANVNIKPPPHPLHILFSANAKSEECQKTQPPLLLKKVSQYASNLYCSTPPICIAVLPVPPRSEERKYSQCSSHLYRSMPPICIAIRLPFVSQCFWENLGVYGHLRSAKRAF